MINSFSREISQQVENKLKELKRKQNQKSNKEQTISLSTKLFIGRRTALMVSVFLMPNNKKEENQTEKTSLKKIIQTNQYFRNQLLIKYKK